MSARFCLILCPGKLLLPALQSEMDGRTTPLNKARKATGLLAGRCISSGFLLPMSGLVCPCCRHSRDSHGKTTPRPKWGVSIQLYLIHQPYDVLSSHRFNSSRYRWGLSYCLSNLSLQPVFTASDGGSSTALLLDGLSPTGGFYPCRVSSQNSFGPSSYLQQQHQQHQQQQRQQQHHHQHQQLQHQQQQQQQL